jgi:hypothetical protein
MRLSIIPFEDRHTNIIVIEKLNVLFISLLLFITNTNLKAAAVASKSINLNHLKSNICINIIFINKKINTNLAYSLSYKFKIFAITHLITSDPANIDS